MAIYIQLDEVRYTPFLLLHKFSQNHYTLKSQGIEQTSSSTSKSTISVNIQIVNLILGSCYNNSLENCLSHEALIHTIFISFVSN